MLVKTAATCVVTDSVGGIDLEIFIASVPLHQILIPRHDIISSDTVETAFGAGVPVRIALVVTTAALLVHACAPCVAITVPVVSVGCSTIAIRLIFTRLSFKFLEVLNGLGDGSLRPAQ